jgi:enamine deaminase RidA (YjgF/YER057c/UK114 family)
MRHRDGYAAIRSEFLPHDPPASTLVQVVALADTAAVIEIEAIATLEAE